MLHFLIQLDELVSFTLIEAKCLYDSIKNDVEILRSVTLFINVISFFETLNPAALQHRLVKLRRQFKLPRRPL